MCIPFRTIFRWITVKNLNTMQFDDTVRTDTPMGLLRGIKHGTESYHVLFKRICRSVLNRFILNLPLVNVPPLQLRGFALCRHQGLLEISRLPARCALRRQPFPQLVERRLRGWCLAIRPVQLGRPPPGQRQRSAETGQQEQIRQLAVYTSNLSFYNH